MKLVPLKDLGSINTGNTPSKKERKFYEAKDIPFIKPDIISDSKLSEITHTEEYISNLARNNARIIPKNSILVTCIGSIGKIGITGPGEYAFNQQINAIVPNDGINVRYFAYCLLFNKKKLCEIANNAVVPIINKKQFSDFCVNINPDIKVQKDIVRTLDILACIIKHRQSQLMKLDELVKCRFVELFGDAKNNPYGWVSETVDSVVEEIIGGVSVSGEARKIQKGELAVLKVSAVTYGVFKCDEYKVISNDIKLGKYVSPKKGDLLFSRANTKELVGATALVDKDYPHLLLPDKIWKIVVSDKVSPVYLKAYLSEPWIRELMSKVATGTSGSMYNISMEKLRQIPVILPPIERQNAFSTFVRRIDKLRFIVEDNLSFLSLVGAFCIVEVGDKSE